MARTRKQSDGDGYADRFKPAIELGRPSTDQWAANFFLTEQLESYDSDGYPQLHYNPNASNSELNSVLSLITTQSEFRPNFRPVEVVGKKDYQALCMENATNEDGLFVYLFKIAGQTDSGDEAFVNLRFMPVSKLADLVVGTTAQGQLQITLPDTDITKLNLTLRASSSGEPMFRTYKTEVLADNVPEAERKTLENSLGIKAGSAIAFIVAQILASRGQWPPEAQSAAEAVEIPWPPADGKKVLAGILVTGGALVVTGTQFYNQNYALGTGAAISAFGSLYNIYDAWMGHPVEDEAEALQNVEIAVLPENNG